MEQFVDNVQDRAGNAIVGATVTVRDSGNAIATIYSDNGVTPAPNPLTTDAFGAYSFYAANGIYTVTVVGANGSTASRTVLLFDPSIPGGFVLKAGDTMTGALTAPSFIGPLTGAASLNVLKAGDTMTGPLLGAVGTASAPGFAFAADTNNGWWSPGPDTQAWSTGGVERLRVDSSGQWTISNAGIVALAVNAAGTFNIVQDWLGAGTSFKLRMQAQDGSVANGIAYRMFLDFNGNGPNNGFIDFYRGGDGASGFLEFGTSGVGRQRISSGGNVTINPPSSGTALTVAPAAGQYSIIASKVRIGDDIVGSGGQILTVSTDPFVYGSAGAAAANLITNSVTRVSVGSSGNVILNTPSSGIALTVNGVGGGAIASLYDGTNTLLLLGNQVQSSVAGAFTINAAAATGSIVLRASGADRVKVSSAGDTLINLQGTAPGLTTNNDMVFTLTSNTNLRISVRGSDGTTRVTNLTLA